jgi:NAD(P)-dependent dehydrogenase (short-subunit alcohol dehydrogenase family)
VGTIEQTAPEDLDRLYAVNVRGVFQVTKAFLPAMLTRGKGSIVNLASIGGIVGIRDRLAYCTTKFAVVGLTKAMALDHARQGIRVNCVCPGRVETPFVTARLREYPDPEAAYRDMASTQAVGRMASAEEIAGAILYLASDEAAFITGSALIIDGGWSAGK